MQLQLVALGVLISGFFVISDWLIGEKKRRQTIDALLGKAKDLSRSDSKSRTAHYLQLQQAAQLPPAVDYSRILFPVLLFLFAWLVGLNRTVLVLLALVGAIAIIVYDVFIGARARTAMLAKIERDFSQADFNNQEEHASFVSAKEWAAQPPSHIEFARLLVVILPVVLAILSGVSFPLILVLAVFFTLSVILLDAFVLKRKRQQAVEAIRANAGNVESAIKQQQIEVAVQQAASEPLVVEYSKSFFPILALVLVLRSFVIEPFQIPSESMVPTLQVGDFILVNKFTYGIRLPVIRNKVIDINEPKRGDVMVFFPPEKDQYFIKRVIGLPGDELSYVNNVLTVNGEQAKYTFVREEEAVSKYSPGEFCRYARSKYHVVEETLDDSSHIMRKCLVPGELSRDFTYTVPDGHYFMVGDNRDNSNDSRAWGPVAEERIVGKAFAIWMHWEGLSSLPSFSRVGKIE